MADAEFMKGTGGGLDYLVFAKTDTHKLGVKAVIEPMDKDEAVFIGVRLRSVPLDGVTSTVEDMVEAWPNIQFMQANEDRASAMIGLALKGVKVKDILKLLEGEDSFGSRIVEEVRTMVDPNKVVYHFESLGKYLNLAAADTLKRMVETSNFYDGGDPPSDTYDPYQDALKTFMSMKKGDGETEH